MPSLQVANEEEEEKQMWLNVLLDRRNFSIDPRKYFICERHWPSKYSEVTLPSGSTHPSLPPSVFNVPPYCLPTSKVPPRKRKDEDRLLNHFKSKDTISSFDTFAPEKELKKKYDNVLISRKQDTIAFIIISEDFQRTELSVIVSNKPSLCSPLTLFAYEEGMSIPVSKKILNPNNGLKYYSQFFEVVDDAHSYSFPRSDILNKLATILRT